MKLALIGLDVVSAERPYRLEHDIQVLDLTSLSFDTGKVPRVNLVLAEVHT